MFALHSSVAPRAAVPARRAHVAAARSRVSPVLPRVVRRTPAHLPRATATPSSSAVVANHLSSKSLQAAVAQDVQQLLDVARKLEDLGVSEDFDVPKLVVCGDQSAGKSSILQRICGIDLPRSDGTCTRCPMEVHLKRTEDSAPWTCKVSLRKYGNDKNPVVVPFGDPMTDKTQVLDRIRRAQVAILNPEDQDMAKYLEPNQLPTDSALKFTEDVVVLEISAPDTIDLTLVDLPGIIHNTPNPEDEKYIDMVENMTKAYISKPETIIVMAISCKTEMESQRIFTLARHADVDPQGERTVGVFTKVDTIEEGTHEKWFDCVKGEQYPLKLGYFMLKNPAQKDLDQGPVSPEAAAVREAAFFATTPPFKSKPDLMNKHAGLSKLLPELSDLLISLLRDQLPTLTDKARERLRMDEAKMRSLPDNLSDRQLTQVLQGSMDAVHKRLGELRDLGLNPKNPDVEELGKDLRVLYMNFLSGLRNLRPMFVLKAATQRNVDIKAADGQTRIKKVPPVYARYPNTSGLAEVSLEDSEGPQKTIYDMMELIEENTGLELPVTLPFGAIRKAVRTSHGSWQQQADTCSEEVHALVKDYVLECFDKEFSQYPRLLAVIREHVHSLLEEVQQDTVKRIGAAVEDEQSVRMASRDQAAPFVADSEGFATKVLEIGASVKSDLAKLKVPSLSEQTIDELIAKMAAQAPDLAPFLHGKPWRQVLGPLHTLTAQQEYAVQLMATVMAYYELSTIRMSETLPKLIRDHQIKYLAQNLTKNVEKQLAWEYGVQQEGNGDGNGHDYAWCEQPPVFRLVRNERDIKETEKQRQELTLRIQRMRQAVQALSTV